MKKNTTVLFKKSKIEDIRNALYSFFVDLKDKDKVVFTTKTGTLHGELIYIKGVRGLAYKTIDPVTESFLSNNSRNPIFFKILKERGYDFGFGTSFFLNDFLLDFASKVTVIESGAATLKIIMENKNKFSKRNIYKSLAFTSKEKVEFKNKYFLNKYGVGLDKIFFDIFFNKNHPVYSSEEFWQTNKMSGVELIYKYILENKSNSSSSSQQQEEEKEEETKQQPQGPQKSNVWKQSLNIEEKGIEQLIKAFSAVQSRIEEEVTLNGVGTIE
jgi:hypothetical protein